MNTQSSAPLTLHVALEHRTYPIVIGPRLLHDVAVLKPFLPQPSVALVTNVTLMPIYGRRLSQSLADAGVSVLPIILPDGEAYKD